MLFVKRPFLIFLLVLTGFAVSEEVEAQHSIARVWNEALLEAIRGDYARPTVHARNLFHTAVVMYDAWAAFDDTAEPYLLGRSVDDYTCPYQGISVSSSPLEDRREVISYAAYRLLTHRFQFSPGATASLARFDSLMATSGYDKSFTSTDYGNGSPAALGNYLAECMIAFGLQDGANEQGDYENQYYEHVNPPLVPVLPGNPDLVDPNRWQPLTLQIFIDQAGNVIPGSTPKFLSPEWGHVSPFALSHADRTIYQRDGQEYWVYHDPGPPPYIDLDESGGLSDAYKWGFALVSMWSSHLDSTSNVLWDISPGAIGNIQDFPQSIDALPDFFDALEGGDPGKGWAWNPKRAEYYKPQLVPRSDYARVLAEFWADGPDSETPPGHWFTILNYVNDHPELRRRYRGRGPELNHLEWDIKAYFALAGAVHDAAVAAWGVKGWYDYIRPISAIRAMADRGQSSNPDGPNYSPSGIPLVDGFIELVEAGDPLAQEDSTNIGKIKLYAWRGPNYIGDPETDVAGVGWILAEHWWPYQRPSFVTPPFAGYVSGHSTFSRAAAEVLTLFTGDPFFPGGMGEFQAPKDKFLVFEKGPSVDVTLQWATYRDAADQCSLSRIWGGIHPPADDIPGRLMGKKIGVEAFEYAERFFEGRTVNVEPVPSFENRLVADVYPSPVSPGHQLTIQLNQLMTDGVLRVYNALGQVVHTEAVARKRMVKIDTTPLTAGLYLLRIRNASGETTQPFIVL